MSKREKTVVIDAGHGGKDPGAIGFNHKEKDIVLDYSLMLANKLRDQGVIVSMTRDTDEFIDLNTRADIGRNTNADAFISVHANAFRSKTAQGVETYYYGSNTNSRRLAKVVHDNILKTKAYTVDRGLKTAGFRVLRGSGRASILLELGFITNKEDLTILLSSHDVIATAITKGVMEFLGLEYKDTKKDSKEKIKVVIDGKDKEIEGFIQDGVSYLSIRDYGDKAGMDIGWDKVKRKILVDTKISDIDIEIDGEKSKVRGRNIDRENYVRVRDIVELLDYDIGWDSDKRVITIKER